MYAHNKNVHEYQTLDGVAQSSVVSASTHRQLNDLGRLGGGCWGCWVPTVSRPNPRTDGH